jgi:putative protease
MRRPEILAPAGDRDALAAALAAGADAVYFGLDDGFNARARAANFPSAGLADVIAQVHRAGARAFIALNTLVFEPELEVVEELVRRVAAAGADAIIVQDPAVALIARALCPAMEIHASTQMTASSPLAAELLAELGLSRVVVPRELSVDEIRAYRAGTRLELEVFVHGALCVAWSGQCLSSEAWGGRSANRGQCAQACRLPYRLVVDGDERDLGEIAYLLSPQDLVGLDVVPELADAGVASLKIEGRLKAPAYVATATAQYAAAVRGETAFDREALQIAYSRGVSTGFLRGVDHQTLVDGRAPRHRGVLLGTVVSVGASVSVSVSGSLTPTLALTPTAGMGVVFDRGRPEEPEQGGPIFGVLRELDGWRLEFGQPGPDLSRVHVGDRVWITSDPRVTKAGDRATREGYGPLGRIGIDLIVRGEVGKPLVVRARDVEVKSASSLAAARGTGLTPELVRGKLGALGGTPFHLASLDTAELQAGLHLPVSELKELRREVVAALDAQLIRGRDVPSHSVIESLRLTDARRPTPNAPLLVPLVRSDAQLDAVLDAGAREVELDWMELVGLARAAERARARGARVVLATVRVQKPGEERIDAHLAGLAPDAVLVRSWGSLAALRGTVPLHGDFSLNVANSITAEWVLARGLESVTAAHDLDRDQLFALLARAPRGRVAVTVHHHIPTFHTEHCVYAHLLSSGSDFKTCGRPCEHHQVALRDRVGLVHPVIVDVGCRNTVFNAQAQSAAALVPELLAHGVRRFRVELVRETAEEARRVYDAYTQLVAGELAPAEAVRACAAHEQFGVTRGTMRTLAVLR